jgi:hypothetical protein
VISGNSIQVTSQTAPPGQEAVVFDRSIGLTAMMVAVNQKVDLVLLFPVADRPNKAKLQFAGLTPIDISFSR